MSALRHEAGRTVIENCQMLCIECNRRKGAR
ncbi:MAG: HNH endonuclease [Bacteroidaceae bacterium]|nr:HNH endonuclease [Bacteroidaceae bacterium]